jgi:hypothetical protein
MLCSVRRIDAVFKFCPEEKMNQRLFKRLILYYNVGNASEASRGRIFTKADSAPSEPSDDSRQAVGRTTRLGSTEQSETFGGFPFRRG